MSASRAKKVKMATKSCPECDQQVPVACKSCCCGYLFINRKYLQIKNSEKSSPFAEANNTVSLKDLRILLLYEFRLGHSAATAANSVDEKSKSCVQITLKSLRRVGRGGQGVEAMDAEVTALVAQQV